MKAFRTGVTVGKFHPPHRGHHFLIDTAATQCERLWVLLVWRPDEEIPPGVRAACLREAHPAVTVIAVEDTLPDDDSVGWAEYTCRLLGLRPDAAFTSEDYGEPWARAMGARHVSVDRARRTVPCAGRAIRAEPLRHLHCLSPFMRALYVRRVCVIGAESTGTTTLARALATHYDTPWVEEYGREYTARKVREGALGWDSAEFLHVAAEQATREDLAARAANRVLVCDTDVFATALWHRRHVGRPSPEVEALADARRADLYLLTGDEIPFEPDAVRDGEHVRHEMHGRFAAELERTGRRWSVLRGGPEARLASAIGLVDALLAEPVRPRLPVRPPA